MCLQSQTHGGCLQNPRAAVLPPGGGDSWRLPQCGNWRGEAHWASSGKEEGVWRERTHQPALQSPLCYTDERKCNDAVQQIPWCHFCRGGWSRVTIMIHWYIVHITFRNIHFHTFSTKILNLTLCRRLTGEYICWQCKLWRNNEQPSTHFMCIPRVL